MVIRGTGIGLDGNEESSNSRLNRQNDRIPGFIKSSDSRYSDSRIYEYGSYGALGAVK